MPFREIAILSRVNFSIKIKSNTLTSSQLSSSSGAAAAAAAAATTTTTTAAAAITRTRIYRINDCRPRLSDI